MLTSLDALLHRLVELGVSEAHRLEEPLQTLRQWVNAT
jgi:hypothetical protein